MVVQLVGFGTFEARQRSARKGRNSEVVLREELNNMPPVRYDTTAVWCRFDRLQKVPGDFAGGLHAAEHALIAVAPLMAMCDRWDVWGVSMAKGPGGSPAIFIYAIYRPL